MTKSERASKNPPHVKHDGAPSRDGKSGKFVEVASHGKGGRLMESKSKAPNTDVPRKLAVRTPGRYKGVLTVGPEFFEPLTHAELAALSGE